MGNTFTDASLATGVVGLCTHEQVKTRAGIPATTANKDAIIDALIGSVLPAFNNRYGREFMPHTTETRTFDVNGHRLAIGDLRTATTVTLDPTGDATVLASGTGYALITNDMSSTATHLLIARDVSLHSDFSDAFGIARISILGDWGIWGDVGEVPADVNEAAIQTVVAWMDRGASNVAGIDMGDPRGISPFVVSTWDIPSSAHRKMQPWAMNVVGG
jgi:hypothetical protein